MYIFSDNISAMYEAPFGSILFPFNDNASTGGFNWNEIKGI